MSEKEQDEAYKPYLYEKNDLKIACFSAGEISFGDLDEGNECGYAWVNSYKLEENIRKIRDMLLEDENIIVIISTTAYYWEIRDYLFSHLKRRKYIDYQYFVVQMQNYEFNEAMRMQKE